MWQMLLEEGVGPAFTAWSKPAPHICRAPKTSRKGGG